MSAPALIVTEDRGIAVPPGATVKTTYVDVWDVVLGCRDRMAVGDVEAAYRRRLAIAPAQPWPCAVGHWKAGRFVLQDGRHDFIAAVMLGFQSILVAWVEEE